MTNLLQVRATERAQLDHENQQIDDGNEDELRHLNELSHLLSRRRMPDARH